MLLFVKFSNTAFVVFGQDCVILKQKNMFSKTFIRVNWITLVLIFLVIIAGSIVRNTGSGMGCPDWPTCFGKWIPPTSSEQLPANYKEIYGEKRVMKVEKFASFLSAIGMGETAQKIKKDPRTYEELPFNATQTWTEYGNRLTGFLAGNGVLIIFLWSLFVYRSDRRLLVLTLLNLIFIGLNGWFGSLVVATNLVPWTITVHMFLAIVVVILQLMIIRRISPKFQKTLNLPDGMKWLIVIILLITTYQIFLGTQVREYIDELTQKGLGRDEWSNYFGTSYFIHRSFSWGVLVLMLFLVLLNYKTEKLSAITIAFGVMSLELICGVFLAYANMPGFVQVSHLLFAIVLFAILFMIYIRTKSLKKMIGTKNNLR